MAIILKIISADGKQVISKVLPAVPSHIKVPPGARVDITDVKTDRTMSLGRYINEHSGKDGKDSHHDDTVPAKVTVEPVDDWASAQQWLDTMEQTGAFGTDDQSGQWYQPDTGKEDGQIMGYDKNTLLIGGLVGVGGAAAVAVASGGGGGPKDTIAPAAPAGLDLATADDKGKASDDNITNVTSGLTFSGTAETGSTVELFDGGTSLGTTTVGADGKFSLDVDLAAGAHVIGARATDAAGNTSAASTALNVIIDTTAPAAPTGLDLATADDTGKSGTDNITKNTSALTISGAGESGATVTLYDGDTVLGTATVSSSNVWSVDVSLAQGTHAITAKQTDIPGNESAASAPLNITVDTTAPLAPTPLDLAAEDDTGASSTDNVTTKTSNLTISGTAEAGSTIHLIEGTVEIGTAQVNPDGSYALDINLAIGQHTIFANATDVAGNVSPVSTALEIEVIAATASSAPQVALFEDPGSTTLFG